MISADLIIFHARQLICFGGNVPLRGSEQGAINVLKDGAIASSDGRIVYVGPSGDVQRMVSPGPGARFINARDISIVPGFVDPHTHAAFAGDRREELRKRLAGASYTEI